MNNFLYESEVAMYSCFGNIIIGHDDFKIFKKNPRKYLAKNWGVSIKKLYTYEQSIIENQCIAITKKGERCCRFVHHVNTIDEFTDGISNVCTQHLRFRRMGG